jgi:hypothetical protein
MGVPSSPSSGGGTRPPVSSRGYATETPTPSVYPPSLTLRNSRGADNFNFQISTTEH